MFLERSKFPGVLRNAEWQSFTDFHK